MGEQASKTIMINGIYKDEGGYYTSKENVLLGTVRVIDGHLCSVKLKHSANECVWYKLYLQTGL